MEKKIRRYDLDWLRVIVFGLLIFYHVGMFFVPWGWHIKNNKLYEWLTYPMLFVNQWRLAILFVISGMGTRYALSHRSVQQFRKERLKRLGIPLLFGMLLIVPPQVYVERLVRGKFMGSYWQFLTEAAFIGIYPEGNISWHHLWFLPYLLLFSLLLSPILLFLRNHPEHSFLKGMQKLVSKKFGLYFFVFPLFLVEVSLEPFFPVTHALVGDWFALTLYLLLFFYGYLLIALGEIFWQKVNDLKSFALVIGIFAFSSRLVIWEMEDTPLLHFLNSFLAVVNGWSWIIVLFGYAAKYLNRKSELLTYCNTAVYPFYILHQTVTVILGYFLMNKEWSFLTKFSLLAFGTFFVSGLLYELLIRRIKWLRPLFGLKQIKRRA